MARRTRVEARDRFESMVRVAQRMSLWKPAGQVLERVVSQPTIFPQVDCGLRTGGWPLKRFALVHGPSGHGKSTMVLGLGLSFLRANHFFGYVDAEFSSPEDWLQGLMHEAASGPGFVALRPRSYEETVRAVREFASAIDEGRRAGDVPEETTGLLVIDSLRKLVPERLLEAMLKEGAGVDGAKGRAAMMKAALNSQWLDELTPLLFHNNISMVVIGREYDNADASPWAPEFKLGGGRAVYFDSSVVARVQRAKYVEVGSGDKKRQVGERHRVRIHKTKVAGKEGKVVDAYFHTSNGAVLEAGFWRGYDVLQMALESGLAEKRGSRVFVDDQLIGEGEVAAATKLQIDTERCALLEAQCRTCALEAQK